MQSTRRLPLQFLCPSWTTRELFQLSQQRGYPGRYEARKWSPDTVNPDSQNPELGVKNRGGNQPTTSLFDELFPDEARNIHKDKQKPRKLGKLPTFDWKAGNTTSEFNGGRSFLSRSRSSDADSLAGLRRNPAFRRAREMTTTQRPAVLLISSLSKTLEESDFMRLSPKAEHIEGWSNGLIKVIQARDTHSLSPLSFYFLLFNSAMSASSYRENLVRLHALSTTQSFIAQSTMPLPTHVVVKPGEDIQTLLKSFTVLPSTSRLFIRMLQEPFTPFIQKMVEEGNHTAIKEQQGKGDALILLELGSGRYSEADIYEALSRSGRRRNLPWKLAGGDRDVEKLNNDSAAVDNDVEDLMETEASKQTARARWRQSRFVIAMKDRHEARRMVREWHRLPLALGRNPPIVNVKTLW